MEVIPTALDGVVVLEPRVWGDERGFFYESYSQARYAEATGGSVFVQDNVSRSARGVLRGLHFQNPRPQGKLVGVLEGDVFDVAVDVRLGSPTFGRWVGVRLSAANHRQLYVPAGFAHGFVVTSETALFHYKCTDYYAPEHEASVRWDDPEIGIEWPLDVPPSLSAKDAAALPLSAMHDRLPRFAPGAR